MVTATQQDKALGIVADWLGQHGLGVPYCSSGRPLDPTYLTHDDGSSCQGVKFGPDAAHLSPPPADLGQQLGTGAADCFGRGFRVDQFVEQLLHARVVRHCTPRSQRVQSRHPAVGDRVSVRVGGVPRGAEVAQRLGEQLQAAV